MSTDTNSSNERITTDRDTIRTWIEARGGIPAVAPGSEGAYRFVRRDHADGVEEDEWNTFFETFDNERLAFVYPENTSEENLGGYKLISRDEAADRVGGDRDAVEDALNHGETVTPADSSTGSNTGTGTETGDVDAGETATTPEEPQIDDVDTDADVDTDSNADTDTDADAGVGSDTDESDMEPNTGREDAGMTESESVMGEEMSLHADEPPTETNERSGVELSPDDRGKAVFNEADEKVGTIVGIEEDTVYVDSDPGLTDRIKIGLGFDVNASEGDTYAVNRSHVREVTADRIVID